jgi:hypothetical protein
LNSPRTTFADRQFVCRVLGRIGSAGSVPTPAKMLCDRELSHMARFALQFMSAPKAGDAPRRALETLTGDLKVGVVGSIAQRGDRKAVPQVAKVINNPAKPFDDFSTPKGLSVLDIATAGQPAPPGSETTVGLSHNEVAIENNAIDTIIRLVHKNRHNIC